jgi:hypothetical protein
MKIPRKFNPEERVAFSNGFRSSMLKIILASAQDAIKSESCGFKQFSLEEIVRFADEGITVEFEDRCRAALRVGVNTVEFEDDTVRDDEESDQLLHDQLMEDLRAASGEVVEE